MPGMTGSQIAPVPIIRMYGVTMEGHSILAHLHGFTPYFFVPAQPNFAPQDCEKFRVRGPYQVVIYGKFHFSM